ncbi:ABC transporter ATP-binding protein [Vallitalea pronyensis]|uniref:ABC transporter ATP-binding protein n=1 Tax=Vallitalea pronyensis TaxID=1348613 RepID=A0A8J8MK46_9FIRM|nr:ABC transporter ATP-binding protein [Vallitalea pronyensis]QUI22956.1 ABC transporter ATP-binding protein [Vallitalea pronyensis]
MKALKWIWQYMKLHKRKMAYGYTSVIIFSFLGVIIPYYIGKIVDEVIEGKDYSLLQPYLLTIIGVALLRTLMAYGHNMAFESLSQGVIFKIRSQMYDLLHRLDFTFFDSNRTGDLMSRMTGDIDAIRHFTAHVSHQLLKAVVMFVFALGMIFTINVKFSLVVLSVAPIILGVALLFSKAVRPRFSDIRKQFSKLNTVVQENVSGNRVVKAFANEDFETEKFTKENEAYKEKMILAASVWEKYLPIMEFFSKSMFIVVILVGGLLVINDNLSYGELVTLNTVIWRVNMPLQMAGWLINDTQRFIASAEKIQGLIDTKPVIKNEGVVLNEEDFPLNGKIEFKNVSFKYKDEPVLKDVSFCINPGQKAAFIGATGSGKSTIMNLICRFYEVDDGLITLDRVNVKNIDLKTLRSVVSIAMQDVFLFTDTIEGNIAYGVPDVSVEQVYEVARLADAHEFIKSFPEGYDTIVGERGVGLSGGQKQRIALARTLLTKPNVLILDDTTSSLDLKTEQQIQKNIETINYKNTTLIIAHRISSVRNADQIFVMEDGVVIEKGTHESLLEQKGHYYDVYKNQLGDFDHVASNTSQKEVNYGA